MHNTSNETFFSFITALVGNFLVKDLITPPPPLGVKNVKIQENSEKSGEMEIQGSSYPKLGIYPFLLKSIHIKNVFINLPES